ncbi:unnamed protein product, partial [Mesorhabditis belari]|uniref:Uncharacterized protein n=1 Tax=Mesorhabditis belari TaxID=2138241 RepID=A0AAF3EBX0_9BILA
MSNIGTYRLTSAASDVHFEATSPLTHITRSRRTVRPVETRFLLRRCPTNIWWIERSSRTTRKAFFQLKGNFTILGLKLQPNNHFF